ncbi:hypothetical protein FLSU104744_16040 [Flavobacterium succinicans]|jgi:hypothetical protein
MTLGAKHQAVPVGNVPAILPKQPSRTPAQLLIPPVGARQLSIVNFWNIIGPSIFPKSNHNP